MKKQEREITWLDTYGEGDRSYSDFVEYCKEQNWDIPEEALKIPAEGSEEYWAWINREIEDDIECFFENLKYEKGVTSEPCIITGELGLWRGNFEIEPVECENLAAAVRKCWSDCDDVRVTGKDGVVYVAAMHHDGTNYFEIRPKSGKRYPRYLY